MTTCETPIRGLSANVQYRAASAQKMYWNERDAMHKKRLLAHREERRASVELAEQLRLLIKAQEELVGHLKCSHGHLKPEQFGALHTVLDLIVSVTNMMTNDLYHGKEKSVAIWRPHLETISDLNDYIENFSESFRIAADASCTALLADVVGKMTAEEVRA